jgi:methylisocitrate lyase
LPYLESASLPSRSAGIRLRRLLAGRRILGMPGAHNGLAALQAKAAGFRAVYLSGAAMSASMGLPDLGLLTTDDVAFFARQIARASGLPVLVDGDTGHGGVLNTMNLVRALEEAGAAAVHIEDQALPKKCGHLKDKTLVGAEEMAEKVAAAVRARTHLYVVARTDAVGGEGLEGAIARAKLYVEAGADAIFPEALTSEAMFREFAREIRVPLLANMTEFGVSPNLTAGQLEGIGYRMVIWPVSSLRVAARAQERLYAALRAEGTTQVLVPEMQTRDELSATIGYEEYEQLDARLAARSPIGGVPRP